MPTELIGKFEEANQIAVHVYELDENECVRTLQGSTLTSEAREHVELLYIENETTSHYCLITDLPKLLHHCSPVESTFAELPVEIAARKACVNVQCHDDSSFRWCVLADKYGGEFHDPAYASNYYQYESEFADYRKPMELSDIKTFERREHISVNVYRLVSEKSIDALQITKLNPDNVLNHIDLLKLNGGHYVLIRDFSRWARKKVTGHDNKHYIFKRCLNMC